MKLRRITVIYQCHELYLYEIMEDYKESSPMKRQEIFQAFCSTLWTCDNKRRTYQKNIHFHVKRELLTQDIGKLFLSYSKIPYQYYKSTTTDTHWYSIIRQKINNLYTRYFDSNIILTKEYMDLIKTPKKLYYQWISGNESTVATVSASILEALSTSFLLKEQLQKEKMTLSWEDYKKEVEHFLFRCFEHCKLIAQYDGPVHLPAQLDCISEDHYYVSYINHCLDGELRKWQKQYYHLPQNTRKSYSRCMDCHALYIKKSNNQSRCPTYTLQDQSNLLSAITFANETSLEVPYHADGESSALHPLSSLKEIYVAQHSNAIQNQVYFNQIKLYILSLTDRTLQSDIDAITYGTKLSGEYLERYNNIISQSNIISTAFMA